MISNSKRSIADDRKMGEIHSILPRPSDFKFLNAFDSIRSVFRTISLARQYFSLNWSVLFAIRTICPDPITLQSFRLPSRLAYRLRSIFQAPNDLELCVCAPVRACYSIWNIWNE